MGAAGMLVVFLYLLVVLSRGCVSLPTQVPPVMLRVLRIPPYDFACSRRWWSRCTCGSMHGRAYLSLPFASYVCGRAGGGWVRLGYASWSPFTFVSAVAVLISCSLRRVAWHVTYLDPTIRVCMLCMFSFFCVFLCVLCFPSVVCGLLRAFFSPLLVLCSPVVPPHTILLVRGGDVLAAIRACTYGHTFHSLCVRGSA